MFGQARDRVAGNAEAQNGQVIELPAPREIRPFAAEEVLGVPNTRRRYRRWSVNMSALVLFRGYMRPCAVYDISPGGARVQIAERDGIAVGEEVVLDLRHIGETPAEVRHKHDGFLGLQFTHEPSDEVGLARRLVALKPPRRSERQTVSNAATIRTSGTELPCVVTNISRSGAAVALDETRHLDRGDEVALTLADHGPLSALVRYIEGNSVGLRFIHPYERRSARR